ncbi:MAG: endo-1,4-beta-xylanase [Saprospiraceae bacterium]|nr:endo-1,4-beta-xylanase [Saprospiraceae bacterium]
MPLSRLYLPLLGVLFSCYSCTITNSDTALANPPSLKTAYQGNFHIGAALNRPQIYEADSVAAALIRKEFNSITAENMMKWMHIHPGVDSFQFEAADKFVTLGEENDMFIVGHTLVWHSQLAPWVQEITDRDSMLQHLQNHVSKIVGRYKDSVRGWDVVNEALNEDGSLRSSLFLELIGDEYLLKAFEWAAAADPAAELYYNDYSLCNPAKREGAIALVKRLQANGVKIDGIGMQGHWGLDSPSLEEIENSILAYSALGVKVMITELDINVIPNPWDLEGADVNQNFEGSPFMDPYPAGLPDSVQIQLAQRYEDIFKLFLKHEDKIARVTFWGVNDGQSWKNDWPIKGRTNYPLLFDRAFQPKKAYHRVMGLKKLDE